MKLLIQGIILSLTFIAASAACGGHFTATSGVFKSPNFPRKYPNNENCLYTFDTGYPIVITCSKFILQKANRKGICKKDYLTISDEYSEQTYCGRDGPTNFISSSDYVEATFKSNRRGRKKGFKCSYSSVIGETTITTTSQSTSTTTTTSPSITTTTTVLSEMLQTAVQLFNNDICYSGRRSTCGCSVTKDDSEYDSTTSGSHRIVVANGIPNHDYEIGQDRPNPNKACPHEMYMAVPLNPTKGTTYTVYGMGPVGIAISGGYFYNHLSTPNGNTAVMNEGESFDTCNGHSDPTCKYHYHELPVCIAGDVGNCTFVGYMRDGFSVYTYCKLQPNSRILKSCYYLTSGDGSHTSHYTYSQTAYDNGDCDLDQANGYTFSDERGYAYIFTEDYPFIMAGYYGTELADLCYLEDQ